MASSTQYFKSNAACGATTGRFGERLPLSLTPGKIFPATQSCRKLTIVLTISTKGKAVPFHVSVNLSEENGLKETSFVKCEQILTISKERLIRCVGRLENERLETVAAAIRRVLEV
jgi:mRNA-degrading endonuclease toxin of MazEF toxin-antitoxin module